MTDLEALRNDLKEYEKIKKEIEPRKEVKEKEDEFLEKLHNLENLYESN